MIRIAVTERILPLNAKFMTKMQPSKNSLKQVFRVFHLTEVLRKDSLMFSNPIFKRRNRMSRKGAGTILLVGFAIMVIILTISAYIAPPSVRVETIVQEDFVDTLSYMTTVMETASRLPGTTEDKINFINRSFSALGRNLAEKGIYFVFTNITMPLEGGNGENIVVIYTLSKEDSYFVGLLATNLTDLQEGIGSGSGGGARADPSY